MPENKNVERQLEVQDMMLKQLKTKLYQYLLQDVNQH